MRLIWNLLAVLGLAAIGGLGYLYAVEPPEAYVAVLKPVPQIPVPARVVSGAVKDEAGLATALCTSEGEADLDDIYDAIIEDGELYFVRSGGSVAMLCALEDDAGPFLEVCGGSDVPPLDDLPDCG